MTHLMIPHRQLNFKSSDPLLPELLPLCLDLTADALTTQNLRSHPSRGKKNKYVTLIFFPAKTTSFINNLVLSNSNMKNTGKPESSRNAEAAVTECCP